MSSVIKSGGISFNNKPYSTLPLSPARPADPRTTQAKKPINDKLVPSG